MAKMKCGALKKTADEAQAGGTLVDEARWAPATPWVALTVLGLYISRWHRVAFSWTEATSLMEAEEWIKAEEALKDALPPVAGRPAEEATAPPSVAERPEQPAPPPVSDRPPADVDNLSDAGSVASVTPSVASVASSGRSTSTAAEERRLERERVAKQREEERAKKVRPSARVLCVAIAIAHIKPRSPNAQNQRVPYDVCLSACGLRV